MESPHDRSEEERRIKLLLRNEAVQGGLQEMVYGLDKNINNQVLAILPPEIKATLRKNITANLANR
jgi:hypothetical protein